MIRVGLIGNHAFPFCSEVYWATALRENGCEAIPIQIEDAVQHPDLTMAALHKCDLVTYTRTHSRGRFLDPSWTARWRELEEGGTQTIGLHLDRYWDLERESLITDGHDPQFTVGTLWTADGGNDARWAAAGVNHRWLVPAIDRTEALRQGVARYEFDVVFTGSGQYHPEYRERDDLLRFLRDRYGDRFTHFGHGGGRPVVREQALSDVLASAKVVIADSCFANQEGGRRAYRYLSDRWPESIGRGAFVVGAETPGLADLYAPETDFEPHTPGDWGDLAWAIDSALGDPEWRKQIAENGRVRVLREHTWTTRVGEVLATLNLNV